MLDLSPAKLLIVFFVAVVLLGPNRLPEVARQMGAAWRRLRDLHQKIEQEVRKNIPDLPPTHEIARMARSPIVLLDQLASMPSADRDAPVVDPAAPVPGPRGAGAPVPTAIRTLGDRTAPPSARSTPLPLHPVDDPGMN